MKTTAALILSILFSACSEQLSTGDEGVDFQAFDSLHLDSRIQNLNEMLEVPEIVTVERKRLLDLLANPIDLESYKVEYGTSNSGNIAAEDLFFHPDMDGIYYQYMLFHKLRHVLESHPSEGDLFRDFRIIVFKYGETVGDFYGCNEEFIAIKCAMKNETLGELDLFGMQKNEIEEKFGEPDLIQKMHAFYIANQSVLSLHYVTTGNIPDDRIKVDWFKIVRVNEAFDLSVRIPSYLLNYE